MSTGSKDRLMFLTYSHIKRDWLDVDSQSQQACVDKMENNTAALYCIAIKDISRGECHYLSSSVHVQMAPNLLPPATITDCLCVSMLTRYTLVCAL